MAEPQTDLHVLVQHRTDAAQRTLASFVGGAKVISSLVLTATDPWADFPDVRISTDRKPADYFHCGSLHLCSSRLRDALDEEAVHFASVDIVGYSGYFAMQFLERIEIINRSASDFDQREDGWIDVVRTLVFSAAESTAPQVFRPARMYGAPVLVRGDLVDRLLRLNLKGPEFVLPHDVLWG